MKLTSVKHLTATGFKNIWVNKLMSIASVGVLVACMSVIGLAVAISLNVDSALSELEQQNVVMVFFNDRNAALYGSGQGSVSNDPNKTYNSITEDDYTVHSYADALLICDKISKLDNIKSVEYVSKEDALVSVKDTLPDSQSGYLDFFEDDEYGNPLPSGARVTMLNLEHFDDTIEKITAIEGVDTIESSRDIAEKITIIKKAITIVGFWIVAILMVISLVIVSNTIRVTMYNRKLEISIMKAVGATDSFVRLPFMIEGVTIGLLSAGVTVTILYFVYNAVKETVRNTLSLTTIIPFGDFFWQIFGIFAVIGCLAGLLSSAFMINKYLRKEGSEFRAL